MENSDDNDKETEQHAMAETSDKSGLETPEQTLMTSIKRDQKTSKFDVDLGGQRRRKNALSAQRRNLCRALGTGWICPEEPVPGKKSCSQFFFILECIVSS